VLVLLLLSEADINSTKLCLLYLLAFLDRTNIGNAKIAKLDIETHLVGPQYNQTLTIFFISYSLFEPITNIMLKRFRPSVFIPIIMYVASLPGPLACGLSCPNLDPGCLSQDLS